MTMTAHSEVQLQVVMNGDLMSEFFPLLQEGIRIRARTGYPLAELLSDQLLLDRDYIAARITTIFIDSRPVDDIQKAIVHDGATIALSGAMPGLVGATMRSGGFYAAMRGSISYVDDSSENSHQTGVIRIKLFNLLMSELGPVILRQGVLVSMDFLSSFLGSRSDRFKQGCLEAVINGVSIDPASLFTGNRFADQETIELRIEFR
jgi:hypothetical protein